MTYGLGLIFSMRLDGRKDIQPKKISLVILYLEIKADVLPPPKGNNKRRKMNIKRNFNAFSMNMKFNFLARSWNLKNYKKYDKK